MSDAEQVGRAATAEAALVASLPEPQGVSALAGDDQPRVRPITVDEALAAWDAGHNVETIEMGGMGAGYEMGIQCVAFELMRALRHDPVLAKINAETPDHGTFPDEFRGLLDAIIFPLDEKQEDGSYKLGGLSGAQAGAAKNLALNLTRHGWDNARQRMPDRLIFVRKQDPRELFRAEQSA